jgi:hypothetical protein
MLTTACIGRAQTDSNNKNLYRYFYNTTLSYGFSDQSDKGGGLEFNVGNNWFLNQGKFCGIIRITWIRLGFIFSDGLYLYASPANLGIGHHFKLNKKLSLETVMHTGPLFVVDDVIQEEGFISYFVMPEIKLNINHFTIGFGYSFKRSLNSTVEGYNYFGLSFGQTFGEI